tara:strand:- start:1115 stop:2197 length:1083 start_codon:yes stop_codon:yes gene_type:complete
MSISTNSNFWTARTNGSNPASPVGSNNDAWSLSGSGSDGSATSGYWRISGSGQTWSITPSSGQNMTLICGFKFVSAPSNGTVLMKLDNGTHKIEVKSKGAMDKLDLVGATTVTTHDLDLDATEDEGVAILLRLTLDTSGNARLFMREIIEDDDANTHYLSVTGASGSSANVSWGNTNGSVDWASSYFTHHGAFTPDEMDLTDLVTTSFIRTGLNIVEILKDSARFYLKTHVSDSAIMYGYDVSSSMISRISPPSIHVIIRALESPDFLTLAGTRTDQKYDIVLYITTRGTDYKNAYRLGLSIMGEVFDELYTNTGLNAGVDSLISYDAKLDSKMDDDEIICVHILSMTYMKKVNMTRREA